MRAVTVDSFGAKPELRDIPAVAPGPGEVAVRVRASSLNGFDALVAAGALEGMFEHRFPLVLGKDFAGTVATVGTGVTGFAPGDAVFGVVARANPTEGGGFAEFLVTGADTGIGRIPSGLGYPAAGALGLAGTTAVACVEAVNPAPGQTVLVCGATGGVGAYTVQLAAVRGATVIATASSSAGAEQVRAWGATYVVDRHQELAKQVRTMAPGGVAAAVHLAGDGPSVAGLVADGGRFASALHVGPEQLAGRNLVATQVLATPTREILERLATEVVAGRLQVPVGRTYRLDQVPGALADFGNGTVGKLSILVDRASSFPPGQVRGQAIRGNAGSRGDPPRIAAPTSPGDGWRGRCGGRRPPR